SLHDAAYFEEKFGTSSTEDIDYKKEMNYIVDITSIYNNVLKVYGENTKTQRYTYGLDVISMDTWHEKSQDNGNEKNNDKTLYYINNELGSVVTLVDDKDKVKVEYNYDTFGVVAEKNHVNDQSIRSNIFHYTGYQYDYQTGLYFANARYYIAEVGRFAEEDVYKGDGLNRYVYVRSNPLRYVDRSGYSSSEGTGKHISPDEQDMDILSLLDMATVIALKRSYVTYAAQNNTDSMNVILRTIDFIRGKEQYKYRYNSKDTFGNYFSPYSYNSSEIIGKIQIHAHNITKNNILAHDETIYNYGLTAIGLFQQPYAALASLVGIGVADVEGNISINDLILAAAGNIPGMTGNFFTIFGAVKAQQSNVVKVGDIQVCISIGTNNSHFLFTNDLNIKDEYYESFSYSVPANWSYYEKTNPTPDIWFNAYDSTKVWFE
ncbi:MAG: wapA3, partial [Clostridiales bacterium]|nr:wapA3 [Clostridiales bacterium]